MSPLKLAFKTACFTAVLSLAPSAVFGLELERLDRGWLWYEDPVVEEEIKEEPKKPEIAASPPKEEKAKPPTPVAPVPEAPPLFTVAWFNANLNKYLDAAIDNPTKENIKTYLLLQAVSLDKAKRFQEQATLASTGDPYLDANSKRSFSSSMGFSIDDQAERQNQALVRKLGENVGVYFFYASECATCLLGAQSLVSFSDRFNIEIIPISVDGKDMPNSPFPTFEVDKGQAELLRITTLPAYVLVNPKIAEQKGLMEGLEIIAQGAVADTGLRERMVIGALKKGWITQQEYDLTKPARVDLNFARILESQGVDSAEAFSRLSKQYGDSTGFIAPERLTQMIEETVSSKIIRNNDFGTGAR